MKTNKKALRFLSVGMTILALAFVMITTFSTNAFAVQRGMGCYQLVTLECGLNLGEWTYCNFTGSYGAPYNCTGADCLGKFSSRHCVPGS